MTFFWSQIGSGFELRTGRHTPTKNSQEYSNPGSNLHVIELTPKFCQSNKALHSNKLSQRAQNECSFAVSVLLNAKSVACIFSVVQQF